MTTNRKNGGGFAARASIAALWLALILIFGSLTAVYAAPVSDADASPTDVGTSEEVSYTDAHFQRVRMVPINVEIPDFYNEASNISGMFFFTLPDGSVKKRIYGALDGVYGWYEPQGIENKVLPGSPLIDTDEDIEMYTRALEDAGIEQLQTSDYFGILPPETGVTAVYALFRKPAQLIFIGCAVIAALLCLLIRLASRISKANENKRNPLRPLRQAQAAGTKRRHLLFSGKQKR